MKSTANELAGIVTRLLSHYWVTDELLPARRAQLKDWIIDLEEFALAVVERACDRWRQQPGGRRPTPGDIRALCIEEQRAVTALPPPTDWDEVEIRRRIDAWARKRDFGGIDDFVAKGHSVFLHLPQGGVRRFGPDEFKFTDQELEERAAWAKLRGFACWNDFLDAVMYGKQSVMPFLAWSAARSEVVAAPAVQGFVGLAAALGASAVPAAFGARTAPEASSRHPDTKIPEHPPGRSPDAPADAVPEFCV